ncbi:MAG: RNA polymerase sigma factor [Candidatus Schekmanbacteria bacterium]|nr:RNA polymerase sigma factor [Candidatus Schekmanbacteria bacterium]
MLALVRQQQTASPAAMAWLEGAFEAHHEGVFRAAYRVAGRIEDAEDVVQTVFLRLARSSEPVAQEVGNLGTYLRRAAVNAALDIVRARTRRPLVALDELDPPAETGHGATPESLSDRSQLRGRLRAALAGLHPRAAQMFVLRYFEGYSSPEIAAFFATSDSVVRVTLHRARAELRKDLGLFWGERA